MGDKGEGGVKILKKWVMSFMDSPIDKLKPIRRNRLLRFGSRLEKESVASRLGYLIITYT